MLALEHGDAAADVGEVLVDALAVAQEHLLVELPRPAAVDLAQRPAGDVVDDEVVVARLRRRQVEVLHGRLEVESYTFGLRNMRPRSPSSDSGSGRRTGESTTTAPARRLAVQAAGGDRDEAAHRVADEHRRPCIPLSSAQAITSSAHVSTAYTGRRPLSPWPDRSTATTWCCGSSSGAMKLHQWACAAPPWTSTRPGRSTSPQRR